MTSNGMRRGLKATAVTVAVSALLLSGCASKRDEPATTATDGSGAAATVNGTFTFA